MLSSPRLHPFWRLALATLCVLVVVTPLLGLARLTPQELATRLIHDYGITFTMLAYPVAFLVLWLFRTQVDKRSWVSLGFGREGWAAQFTRGAFAGFATLGTLFCLLLFSGAVRFEGLSNDVLSRGWPVAFVSFLTYLVAFVGVGVMEETAFRGYALHNLNEWLGWKRALFIQSAVFAAAHLQNGVTWPETLQGGFSWAKAVSVASFVLHSDAFLAALRAQPSLFLVGVLFALCYRKTGSLWFPIGFHTLWNWTLGCLFSLPVSGISTFRLFNVEASGANLLSGGKFGAEGSLFLIPLLVAMIYVLSRAPDHPRAIADLRGETQTAPASHPVALAPSSPVAVEPEDAQAPRSNRYRARFGSGEGFDSGMLAELKAMQEAREGAERQKRETEEALRRAETLRTVELTRARLEAQAVESVAPAPIPVQAAPERAREGAEREDAIAVEPAPAPETALVPVVEAPVAAEPRTSQSVAAQPSATPPAPSPEAPPAPATTPTAPKKARPRW